MPTRPGPHTQARTHARSPSYAHGRTDTHTQKYVILITFPLQQKFRERASMFRYTYIACLVHVTVTKAPAHFKLPVTSAQPSVQKDAFKYIKEIFSLAFSVPVGSVTLYGTMAAYDRKDQVNNTKRVSHFLSSIRTRYLHHWRTA